MAKATQMPNESAIASEGADKQRIRQLVYDLARDLGARYSESRSSLDAFEVYDDAQKQIVSRLRSVVANIAELVASGTSIIFVGTVGTGKDHLLSATLYAAARAGLGCRWVNGQEVYGQFRDRMDSGDTEEELLRTLVRPQVLGISDPIPAVGSPSAYNSSQLYRLVDRRYRMMRPTWVTLNSRSSEEAMEKLSAPVFDRLRDGAVILPCMWPSYRARRRR